MYEKITNKVLVQLRGKEDRLGFSKKLGYSYNQYFKFEAGYKKFKLCDFIKTLAVVPSIDSLKLFNSILELNITNVDQESILNSFCNVWGNPSNYVIEQELGMSISKWWRIKNGKSTMDFSDFLLLLDVMTGRLLPFLEEILSEAIIEELVLGKGSVHQAYLFLQKYPESALITTGLYNSSYMSADPQNALANLQKLTGIPKDKFDFLLEQMLNKNILYYEEGFLKSTAYKIELKSLELEVGKSLLNFILGEVKKENDRPVEEALGKGIRSTYKIASVTPKTKELIIEELKMAYKNISSLITNDPVLGRSELILLEQAVIFR